MHATNGELNARIIKNGQTTSVLKCFYFYQMAHLSDPVSFRIVNGQTSYDRDLSRMPTNFECNEMELNLCLDICSDSRDILFFILSFLLCYIEINK